jgi:hypothetical protein
MAKAAGGASPAPTGETKGRAECGPLAGWLLCGGIEATLQGFLPAVFSLSWRLADRRDLVNFAI